MLSPARLPSDPYAVMHLKIVEAVRQLTRRYVASVPHCSAMWIGLRENYGAGGTDQAAGRSASRYSGPGGHDRNTAPEYFGLMGVAHGPLRSRRSGKGRAVPERPPVDPGRSSFRCDFMGRVDHMSGVEKGSIACSAPTSLSRDRLRGIGYATWEWE